MQKVRVDYSEKSSEISKILRRLISKFGTSFPDNPIVQPYSTQKNPVKSAKRETVGALARRGQSILRERVKQRWSDRRGRISIKRRGAGRLTFNQDFEYRGDNYFYMRLITESMANRRALKTDSVRSVITLWYAPRAYNLLAPARPASRARYTPPWRGAGRRRGTSPLVETER